MRYENDSGGDAKKVVRKKVLQKKVMKQIRRKVKNKKSQPIKKRKSPVSSTDSSNDEDDTSKRKSVSQSKQDTIKSLTIDQNMTKDTLTKGGEKIKTDVAAELFIEKHPITDELDVDLDLTIEPKSEKPMNVNVEALLDNEEATVTGTATGKDKGKAVIETEVHHSDYYEKNHKTAKDWDDITLDLTKKNKASDDMDLDATADDKTKTNLNSVAGSKKVTRPSRSRSKIVDRKASKPKSKVPSKNSER